MQVTNVIDLTHVDTTCVYCHTVFANAGALKKHKQRKNACISYQDMDARFTTMMNRYYEECARHQYMAIEYEKKLNDLKVSTVAIVFEHTSILLCISSNLKGI